MYEPGRGTWFSARFSIDPPTKIYYNHNFNHEPVLTPPMAPAHYAEDLKMFPRHSEHIPGRLAAKLAAAGEGRA
jgi:hypothetical protein